MLNNFIRTAENIFFFYLNSKQNDTLIIQGDFIVIQRIIRIKLLEITEKQQNTYNFIRKKTSEQFG